MQPIFSRGARSARWRRLWLALAETERELGLDIPDEAMPQMRASTRRHRPGAGRRVRAALPPRRHGPRPPVRRRRAGGARHHPPGRHQRLHRRQHGPDPAPGGAASWCGTGCVRCVGGPGGLRPSVAGPAHAGVHPFPAGPAHHRGQAGHALDPGLPPGPGGGRASACDTLRFRGVRGTTGHAGVVPGAVRRRPRARWTRWTPLVAAKHGLRAAPTGERPDLPPEGGLRRPRRRWPGSARRPPSSGTTCACWRTCGRWRSRSRRSRSAPRPCPTSGTPCAPSASARWRATSSRCRWTGLHGGHPVAGAHAGRLGQPAPRPSPTRS